MGVLGDWGHPYLTMNEKFKATIVEVFEELQKKGYVYKGKKPVYWCATDETALAEAEVEYENDTGPSIYVAFPHAKTPNTYFVIWTTTPWTLPANVAIAYNPREKYVVFESTADKRRFIVAQERLADFEQNSGLSGKVVESISLADAAARHPWINRDVK